MLKLGRWAHQQIERDKDLLYVKKTLHELRYRKGELERTRIMDDRRRNHRMLIKTKLCFTGKQST